MVGNLRGRVAVVGLGTNHLHLEVRAGETDAASAAHGLGTGGHARIHVHVHAGGDAGVHVRAHIDGLGLRRVLHVAFVLVPFVVVAVDAIVIVFIGIVVGIVRPGYLFDTIHESHKNPPFCLKQDELSE